MAKLNVVDLFCGAGGFSLGAKGAGLNILKAIDIDPDLTSSYNTNFGGDHLYLGDISTLSGNDLRAMTGETIHGLIGGPPCQGFSLIGRRDQKDPRRALVDHFFRLVEEVRPTFFVMENVLGLLQGEAREVFDAAVNRVPGCYTIVGPTVVAASDFGVPTSRQRVFVIGVLADRADLPSMEPPIQVQRATVRDAIADLLAPRELVCEPRGFDLCAVDENVAVSAYARTLRSADGTFTGNRRTAHTDAVVARFRTIEPGRTDPVGRHQRLAWNGLCPTLRAGTGSDKGSYQSVRPIHPDQPRVITVREAARLQGFPDAHRFHPTIWHSFRMIGNSVSPPVAKTILERVVKACSKVDSPTEVKSVA